MVWNVILPAAVGLLGSSMQASSAKSAAQTQAAAEVEAAKIAAREARFSPVAITTGFGRSAFETDPEGRVSGASYQLTPELQALRDQILSQTQQGMGLTQRGLGAAEGLFGLGQQYMAQTPELAAQQWMASQQAALAPSRQQAMSGLMNKLAQTGTQGLGVAQAGGGMANPLAQAFANSIAQQDLDLASRSTEQGRAQTQFGTGLFADALKLASGGYSPLTQQLQAAQGIESLGQEALNLGSALGGRIANPSGASALMQGGMSAANTLGQVAGYNPVAESLMLASRNPALMGGLSNLLSGISSPSPNYSLGLPATSSNAYMQSWFGGSQ